MNMILVANLQFDRGRFEGFLSSELETYLSE